MPDPQQPSQDVVIALMQQEIELLKESQKSTLAVLQDIKHEMTRYKGFLGGCIFLLSCMWTAALTFKDTLFHR